MIRSYSELSQIDSFEGRYEYLRLRGEVGESTFGSERYLNQRFYTSREWKQIRIFVIARDLGTDLGIKDRDIHDKIIIHHMNPMTSEDIIKKNLNILDPEFLISTSHNTHNAIHYGDSHLLISDYEERTPGDTKLW